MSAPLKQGGSQAEPSPEISDKTVHVLEVRSYTYVGHSTHTFALVGAEVLEEGMAANKRSASAMFVSQVRTNQPSVETVFQRIRLNRIYCLLLLLLIACTCLGSQLLFL